MLEQDTIKKGRVDKEVRQMEFDAGDDKSGGYKVGAIQDSTVHARKSESDHLSDLYYLISWKRYSEEENTWEPASVV